LVQGGANPIVKLGDGNVEKFSAVFRREAYQNSKNKTVPQDRLQHKEAAEFKGKKFERIPRIRQFRSSTNSRPDGLNQETAIRQVFTSVNSVHYRRFGSLRVAREKQRRAKGHIKRIRNCVYRHFLTVSESPEEA
jgi:hypothetical protein